MSWWWVTKIFSKRWGVYQSSTNVNDHVLRILPGRRIAIKSIFLSFLIFNCGRNQRICTMLNDFFVRALWAAKDLIDRMFNWSRIFQSISIPISGSISVPINESISIPINESISICQNDVVTFSWFVYFPCTISLLIKKYWASCPIPVGSFLIQLHFEPVLNWFHSASSSSFDLVSFHQLLHSIWSVVFSILHFHEVMPGKLIS